MNKRTSRKRRKRKCRYCHCYFIPYPHILDQQFCSTPDCQAASHRLSSKKYRHGKLKNDPRKWDREKARVRKHQHAHPDYKKKQRERKKNAKKSFSDDVLRDLYQGGKAVNLTVLRDLLVRLIIVNKGLMFHYFDVLRDNIDELEVTLYNKGSALFRDISQNPESPNKGVYHEKKKPYSSGPSPPAP